MGTSGKLQFVDSPPVAKRVSDQSEKLTALQSLCAQLQTAPNRWALVASDVRSPEYYFPLRNMSCKVTVRPGGKGTAVSNPNKTVQLSNVWASFVPGYDPGRQYR